MTFPLPRPAHDNPTETFALVTGATGFIGRWLLADLTSRGRLVAAMVRNAANRSDELAAWVNAHGGNADLLTCFESDLTGDLGMHNPRLQQVTDIYHLGANFSFGLDIDTAIATNVAPTLALVRWAATLGNFRRFVLVTGYRFHGTAWQEIAANPSDKVFAAAVKRHGAYEVSKMRAEMEARSAAQALGVAFTSVHPAVVIGHGQTGETSQLTGIGESIRDLWRGDLPALPATKDTWLPMIPVDWVAAFLTQVPEHQQSVNGSYPLLDPGTPRFVPLIDRIASHLGVKAPRLRVHPGLLRRLPSKLTGVTPEQLSFISSDTYDMSDTNAIAQQMDLPPYQIGPAVERWVDHLLAAEFDAEAL